MLRKITRIAAKELTGFFASPAAVLFLAAFLGVTLFVFFWAAAFFERNLADVRPLFQWMPVLLIFLVATLTMRTWAEERRSGTLELLLTSPTTPTEQVLGKFLGVLVLVLIALALTLPLPISVSFLGPLDWGPVIGGYAAAICLAAAYVSIGLWISSRTDNQIVSLILTVVIAGAFYLIGSDTLTNLVGYRAAEWLHDLGAGSRFASITRGVLDLRDLYYYFSITATFLVLNRLSLERLRWAGNSARAVHRGWYAAAALLAANLLGANFWLGQIGSARVDLTSGRLYTLSDATRSYLGQLQEPLLIRGYFSAATHPLLAPLVPQLRDLLQEYAEAGGQRVRVEFVDPHDDPKVEAEANDRYSIRPVPFEVAGKYRASVVNTYFDILVSYGDQYQVLTFRDLIDVKARDETNINVELKDPEYAITSAIRKVLLSYQGGGSVFDVLHSPLTFTGYVSARASLPEQLQSARIALDGALGDLQKQAHGKLQVKFQDPDTDKTLSAKLSHDYGFHPMVLSLNDAHPFWFYMTLSDGHQTEQIPLPSNFDQAHLKDAIDAVVKRFSPGLLKTIAVVSPPADALREGLGGESFSTLRQSLSGSARWLDTDLKDGRVPADADMLMVLEPMGLQQKQVFAIDQFLMQGGTVLIATAPQDVAPSGDSLNSRPIRSGLTDWLARYGLSEQADLVLDRQSGALPIPVRRNVGGATIEELELAKYPYIVDVRGAGLSDNPITRDLEQIDMPWSAPIAVDARRNQGRKVTVLLRSSPQSWLSNSTNLTDFDAAPTGPVGSHPLAVMLEGRFDSAFQGQPSPLLSSAPSTAPTTPSAPGGKVTPTSATNAAAPAPAAQAAPIDSVIDHSPASARLILVGSSTMFSDQVLQLLGQATGRTYDKPVQFVQNIADWSLADQGLMGIRGREQFARTLAPLSRGTEQFWEYLNYGVALGALALVWAVNRRRRARRAAQHLQLLQEG
ncbi:MAG TPA: Gldg family protein [Steroidobacteraceae bacterium]|nr:Gldg family protein [Steroidobacteraceae bacterium]